MGSPIRAGRPSSQDVFLGDGLVVGGVYSSCAVCGVDCVAWGIVRCMLSGMYRPECCCIPLIVFKVSGSGVLGCTILAYAIAMGGADLTFIVCEEGKYRLEECCVYASVSSATFVRTLLDR